MKRMATVQSTVTLMPSPSPRPTATVAPVVVKPWYQTMITDTATMSYPENRLLVTQLGSKILTYTLNSMFIGSMEEPETTLRYRANIGNNQIRFEQSRSSDGQTKIFWSGKDTGSDAEQTQFIDSKTQLTFRTNHSNPTCAVNQIRIGEAAWGDGMSLMVMLLPFGFDSYPSFESDGADRAIRYVGKYVDVELIGGQPAYRFKINMSQTLLGLVKYDAPLESGDIWIAVVNGHNQIKRISINTTDRIDEGGRPRRNEMLYGELVAAQLQDYAVPTACQEALRLSLTATPTPRPISSN